MSTRQTCFLLDAMVVITLHQLGLWERLGGRVEIAVAATVAGECHFYEDEAGVRHAIDWSRYGFVRVEEAPPDWYEGLQRVLDHPTLAGLDAGEAESLGILREHRPGDLLFSTSDKAAVLASCLLGYGEAVRSVETLLRTAGLARPLPHHLRDATLRTWVDEGKQRRLTGLGLR